MAVVFGALAPHGGIAVAEACTDDELPLAAATRAGMEELGRRFAAATPESVVVLTPHHVHLEGLVALSLGARAAGELEGTSGRVALSLPVDRELLASIAGAMRSGGVPSALVGFDPSAPEDGMVPMDWGTLIPLWFMGGRDEPPRPVVMVSPSRDLDCAALVAAGRAIAVGAEASGRRVAVIASGDHGHGHRADGPYGFNPASAEYDARIVDILRRDRLEELEQLDRPYVENALADSWWQMLVLRGALDESFSGELLTYEAPTYFGMATASFASAAGGGAREGLSAPEELGPA